MKTKFDLIRQISSTPVHNKHLRVERRNKNSVIIEVDLLYRGALLPLSKIFKLKRQKCYLLDGVALTVFESIDGKKTFEDIIDGFANIHKLTFFESRALLMQYFKELTSRGLIGIIVPKPSAR